jgi:hypothetical protein
MPIKMCGITFRESRRSEGCALPVGVNEFLLVLRFLGGARWRSG